MAAKKIIFACDESGAKGYADQTETFPGEVGVFAGILVPEEVEATALANFQAIYDQYKPDTGKLHIADLLPEKQESLRQDVYAAIRELKLPCFWYAIHVEGLHNWHLTQQQGRATLLAARAARGEKPRVRQGSNREDPASMHEELFGGLYANLIAFLAERGLMDVSIEVRTDKIDSPIVKNFEVIAKRLLRDTPLLKTVKGFDTVTRKIVQGQIKVETVFPEDMKIDIAISELSINPVSEDDGFVLAADVLANSLNYLFKHRDGTELYAPLNRPSSISKHPLAACLDAFYDWGDGDLIGDRIYRHPKSSVS